MKSSHLYIYLQILWFVLKLEFELLPLSQHIRNKHYFHSSRFYMTACATRCFSDYLIYMQNTQKSQNTLVFFQICSTSANSKSKMLPQSQ